MPQANRKNNIEVGFVQSVKDFLVTIDGLPSAKINDIVANEQGSRGLVNALLDDQVEVLMLDEAPVLPGQIFSKTSQRLMVPIGSYLLGRAINPLGLPIDGKGPLPQTPTDKYYDIDTSAPGIDKREFINRQFVTGITIIDTLIPIGMGQRELILGDARSGKTDFLINIIINQSKTDGVICVYAVVGKPVLDVRNIIDTLQANKALDNTIVIASSSTDTAPLIYLTPQTAMTVAEWFAHTGKDVLVILDDMGNHAKIYREIALLGNQPPGRESYPGDIFYQHAHLLERAGNFNSSVGGGSITALPVIEINLNDFTTFIPTNLMGATDGHLLFKAALYNQAQRPAIDLSLSVSRVGQQTQHALQNKMATKLKQILAQAVQLETVSRFSFELPVSTQMVLRQKNLIMEILRQQNLTFISIEIQTILLGLVFTSFMQDKNTEFIANFRQKITEAFTSHPTLSPIAKNVFSFKSSTDLLSRLESVVPLLASIINPTNPPPPISPANKPTIQKGEAI